MIKLKNEQNCVTYYKLTSISNETKFTATNNIIMIFIVFSLSHLKSFYFLLGREFKLADCQRTVRSFPWSLGATRWRTQRKLFDPFAILLVNKGETYPVAVRVWSEALRSVFVAQLVRRFWGVTWIFFT